MLIIGQSFIQKIQFFPPNKARLFALVSRYPKQALSGMINKVEFHKASFSDLDLPSDNLYTLFDSDPATCVPVPPGQLRLFFSQIVFLSDFSLLRNHSSLISPGKSNLNMSNHQTIYSLSLPDFWLIWTVAIFFYTSFGEFFSRVLDLFL